MEGNVPWATVGTVTKVVDLVEQWRTAGAHYVGVNTMGAGFTSVDDHLRVLAEVAEALQLSST
jgi:alkanesulfonate monooxygenase SsuD/methylene tetrahydromethanopterin reductase-like flavin-dependent oxidoreductase (luciferase family)